MLLLGTIFIAVVPFGYIFSNNIWHLYVIQFIYGLGAGFAYPAWSSLFTSHLEKGQRGFQWSIYNSSVGLGTALTAWIGAYIAEKIGLNFHFLYLILTKV